MSSKEKLNKYFSQVLFSISKSINNLVMLFSRLLPKTLAFTICIIHYLGLSFSTKVFFSFYTCSKRNAPTNTNKIFCFSFESNVFKLSLILGD